MLCYQLTSAIEWEFVMWALAQQQANVVYPTPTDQSLPNVGLALGQRTCLPNAKRTNNYPTLPNVCRTSEQALVKMVSSSTIHKTLSMSFASVANSLAKLIDVFIYNALKHFSCVFYLYIII